MSLCIVAILLLMFGFTFWDKMVTFSDEEMMKVH